MSNVDFQMADLTVIDAHTQDGQVALRFAETDRLGALVVRWEIGKAPLVLLLTHEESAQLAEKELSND